MKNAFLHKIILTLILATVTWCASYAQPNASYLSHDGVMRYYRLALPVTNTCFHASFEDDNTEVYDFWNEAEDFLNKLYLPLNICIEVIHDDRMILTSQNSIDRYPIDACAWGTEYINDIIGEKNYDLGLWISEPADFDNSGVSILGGAYNKSTKGSGYAQKNVITIAHELGHLFGAVHTHDEGAATEPGMGQSVMGYGSPSDFFSLASIHAIFQMSQQLNSAYYSDEARTTLVGTNNGGNYVFGKKATDNRVPKIDATMLKTHYTIPQGCCFAINIPATDADNDRITYAFQQYEDGASFCAYTPSESSIIDFHPQYTLFPFDDFLFINDGTDVPSLMPGTYRFIASANDLPSANEMTVAMQKQRPFVSQYTTFNTEVEIISGTPFTATLSPNKLKYEAGETIKISWGVNNNYFTSSSRLRICLSDDYGQTFKYILAENIPALNGSCSVKLPNINFDAIEISFGGGAKEVRPGIIRIEVEGDIAYTLSSYSPEDSDARGGFTMTGGTPSVITSISNNKNSSPTLYNLNGTIATFPQLPKGIYIQQGKKVWKDNKR
jgi:hypothetical protein